VPVGTGSCRHFTTKWDAPVSSQPEGEQTSYPLGAGQEAQAKRLLAFDLVADELARVECKIEALLVSREPILSRISSYLLSAGGKRIRPAIALLVFKACGGKGSKDIVDVAVALELIHSATLLHDDIIDSGGFRRGQPSAFATYGLGNTLVAGDFLFSKAFQLCGRFEEKIVDWAAQACIALTEGEVMQSRFRHNSTVTLDDYLEIITRKTASLFSQGARVAAHLAHGTEPRVETMWRCGLNIGMAFQIVDDILDVDGDSRITGKPVGADLRDGNPSLPIVLALNREEAVRQVFGSLATTQEEIDRAIAAIRSSGVIPIARQLATDYASRARSCLQSLPESSFHQGLAAAIDLIEGREL